MHSYFDAGFLASAHRGGYVSEADRRLENSMAAFERAASMGYRCLETDVHATRDGVVLAFHDERLDRVTDHTGLVREMTFEQVSAARIGGREPIPTLAEVLTRLPDMLLNIDIKHPSAIEPLVEVLRRHDAGRRVAVASFNGRTIRRFRSLMPEVCTGVAPGWIAACAVSPGLPDRLRIPGNSFQIPLTSSVIGREVRVFSPALLRAAHRVGMAVQVWTVNEREQMERLLDLGVDGIITDRIDVLRDVCRSRGMWP